MTHAELDAQILRLRDGSERPVRVVVNELGYATSPGRAARDHGVHAQICYIRSDGWTLAAPLPLAGVAWGLWSDRWVAVVPLPCYAGQRLSDN